MATLCMCGWLVFDAHRTHQVREHSRAEITAACQGLVDPERVMRFGGKADKVEAAPAGDHLCVLSRAGTFEGQEQMDEYFSLTVVASKGAEPGGSRVDPGNAAVSVTAKCADPATSGGVTSLRVTAASEYDRSDRGEPGELEALAREAALRAAAKAGCETVLPSG
ncbi:hypothetical protein ACWGDE_18910 [Streptomyces sp. NPDC054956]